MLDRKTEPEIHDFDLLTLPKADCRILPNGVPLYVIDMGDQEVNRIDIMFNAGRYEQNVPLAAEAANAMLREGCRGHLWILQKNSIFTEHGCKVPYLITIHI